MQRKNTPTLKNKYVKSGIAGKDTPGGSKPSQLQRMIQIVIIGAIALMGCIIVVYLISGLFRDTSKPIVISARPGFRIQPFGKEALCYDGMTLSCIDQSGNIKWKYTLGLDADYYATKTNIVAWTGNQIHVLDKNGNPIYTDRMNNVIRFARVGESLLAVCVGEDTNSTVQVLSLTGIIQESLPFPDLFVFDMGFFSQKGKLLWVLSLDLNSNVPITNISTHEPGRLLLGKQELNNQLIYNLYLQDTTLMLVDTTQIRAYSYKCVSQANISPILVYGWQMVDLRTVGRNTYSLFQHMPQSSDTFYFSELRLVNNQTVTSLRLLSPCFASGLNDKGVYGFSDTAIYYAPYGSGTFKTTSLPYVINDFICMLDGGYAVLVSGNEVFLQKLPE